MASSNVQYYEKQKELQDTITNCEQQRMNLERQFRIALQADQTSSKMKAARLHTYWKKICEDERRAKQRNEMLLREFERIDAHMSEMNARTQRLALMKKQYEDYIARTYPQWNELMNGSPRQQPSSEQPQHGISSPRTQQSRAEAQLKSSQRLSARSHSSEAPTNIRPSEPDVSYSQQPVQDSQTQQTNSQIQKHEEEQRETWQQQQKQQQQLQEQQLQQQRQQYQQKQQPRHWEQQQKQSEESAVEQGGSGIYANLPGTDKQGSRGGHIEGHDEEEEMTSQPIKSVEIMSKTSGGAVQTVNKSMKPEEDEDDEEETSEFGTDSDLPMGQSLGNTQVKVDVHRKEEQENSMSKFGSSIKPELSVDGLINLLHLVEKDILDAFSLEGYYRSSWPDSNQKNDIIRKANNDADLSHIDANLISMVILEQITLIVRNLTERSVLPESLLQGDLSSLTAAKLRQHLSPEAQLIWDSLYAHFIKLVKSQVMEPYELSAIFTPCLVADGGSQDKAHSFIVKLLEEIQTGNNTNQDAVRPNWTKSVSPGQTLEGSGSFVEEGKAVPPLKFGSLLDKPLSDDESSYVNSSLPRDPVPLNETAAYKNMISGTASSQPQRQVSSAPEDTDDDVEKQIATALAKPAVSQPSPRKRVEVEDPSETSSQTLQTSPHVYVPTAMETGGARFTSPRGIMNQPVSGPPKYGVKISSDLDTDTEVDAGIFGSSRQAADNEFDFYD